MALVRLNRRSPRLAFQPFAGLPGFEDVENRMRKMMDEMVGEAETGTMPIGWLPAVEITELPSEMVVSAELPGIDRKDVDISVQEGMLTLSGEKTEEKAEGSDEKKYHLWERSYGSFQRSFALPRGVDASKISAEFKNGVLKIHLPKTSEAQAKGRKIDIAVT
jgi:HSP20 family protein